MPLDIEEMESITVLLMRGFYSMAFQPIVSQAGADVFGYEALLRGPVGTPLAMPWRLFNQDGYMDVGLLSKLDLACIGSAIRTGRMLVSDRKLFINIHGNTLPQLPIKEFLKLLEDVDIDPGSIVLEISEKTNQDHVRDIARRLKEFRDEGVKVALDDVGSRNPWLLHMLWLEPEYIKLDRVLIHGIDAHPGKQKLVKGLLLLSEQMGSRVITEGVETELEARALEVLGVPLLQGYYYGRPQPAEKWLGDGRNYQGASAPQGCVSFKGGL